MITTPSRKTRMPSSARAVKVTLPPGMLAGRRVALANVVVRTAPFQRTVEAETTLFPYAVRVNAGLPAVALFGVSVVRVGGRGPDGLIVKVCVPEVWPSGLRTLTEAEPAAGMSAAGMLAVSRVALTNVVVRAAPFQRTVAPETKLFPSAVSVKAAPPAVALFGVSVVRPGAGAPPPPAAQLTWMSASPVCS